MGYSETTFLEGVQGKFKNLQLSEAEKKGIRIGKKQACSSQVNKLQAVGKLLSERPARAEHVGRSLGGAWSPIFGVECKELGRNRFLFTFHQKTDKDKALDAGPWRFNNDLLVMEDFVPSRTIDEYEFKTIPIWIRAYGIPMGMMSKETGDAIGEQVGEVIDVDLDVHGDSMGVFMRIKVRIDITVPIMRFITFYIGEEEEEEQINEMILGGDDEEEEKRKKKKEKEEKIVSLIYEYLPDFCYSCGIIGHTKKSCPTRSRRTGSRQFGPWLRAIMYKGSSSEEKSRSSDDKGKFWTSNSTGSKGNKQGSDGPSWRRIEASREEDGGPRNGEGKEVTSPLKLKRAMDSETVEGKSLNFDGKFLEAPPKSELKLRDEWSNPKGKNNNDTHINEVPEEPVKEIPVQKKEEVQQKEGNKIQKSAKGTKQRTFKHLERRNDNEQVQSVRTEPKKRNVDLIVVDEEIELTKRAKMEVDGDDEKEENTNSDAGNAGLQGQPGVSK